MPVFFSVVIPTYNRANHIAAVIQSFLDQEFRDFEIIVVDDGSKDDTRERIAGAFNDDRITYYYKENGERGAARNYGAIRGSGKYVTFFDSDDVVYPYYLSHAAEQLSRLNHPECYAQAFEFRTAIPSPYPARKNGQTNIVSANKELANNNFLACNGVFIRKDLFDRFGFSDNRDLSGSEDWFFWLQLAANFNFYYSPVVCSCLINHEGRGELNVVASKLIKRLDLLLELLKKDKEINKYKPSEKRTVLSSGYLFAALKLADFAKLKLKSVQYLLKAFILRPTVLSRKSVYVTAKKLLFSWHSAH